MIFITLPWIPFFFLRVARKLHFLFISVFFHAARNYAIMVTRNCNCTPVYMSSVTYIYMSLVACNCMYSGRAELHVYRLPTAACPSFVCNYSCIHVYMCTTACPSLAHNCSCTPTD